MPQFSPTMRAVALDGRLRFISNYPTRTPKPGWAIIQVLKAGICQTDLELMKGYMSFKGVLGHEFVGAVHQCDAPQWVGKRVVGEINAACGHCPWCQKGLGRHCPNRTVLGIVNHDGCMADYCRLPLANLMEVPQAIPDDRAVFVEPLSAACEMLEQLGRADCGRVVVLGDGRLGILCAWVMATVASDVTLAGHHANKLRLARWRDLKTVLRADQVSCGADVVVEATGSGAGLVQAMKICRPRGTIVLKSTLASQGELNLAPLVVNEQTIIGSRCGRFADALRMLMDHPDMPVERLITDRYPIERAEQAFDRAREPEAIKVMLEISQLPSRKAVLT